MGWKNRRVLVTGAGGFVGSHLAERLLIRGARVRALVRYNSLGTWGWLDHSNQKKEIEIFAGDVREKDSLKKAFHGIDVVFHLAALIGIPYSYETPASYVKTNIEGTLNVLQLALDSGAKVIHTSTSEVYGTACSVPISEEHLLRAQSPYAASKIAADKIVEAFHFSYGLPVVTVRPFNIFGPRQSMRAVIPTIIGQILNGTKIQLGNLKATRDLNFVTDTVEGFLLAGVTPRAIGRVINLGSGREISIGDLAKKILRLMGRNNPILTDRHRIRPHRSEVERLCANSAVAKQLLRWEPTCSLENGLRETISWIEENSSRYQSTSYAV
ncbi:MAG: SDR family NAD(P)-dependent oxidoreductase [Elusimicrobia bacterium]|jgi:NAD dependent epimerase/dehydratase|nr:SDR family NAD(P)-dependent oxidoreductase [Elusimicrobiota bacterium]